MLDIQYWDLPDSVRVMDGQRRFLIKALRDSVEIHASSDEKRR